MFVHITVHNGTGPTISKVTSTCLQNINHLDTHVTKEKPTYQRNTVLRSKEEKLRFFFLQKPKDPKTEDKRALWTPEGKRQTAKQWVRSGLGSAFWVSTKWKQFALVVGRRVNHLQVQLWLSLQGKQEAKSGLRSNSEQKKCVTRTDSSTIATGALSHNITCRICTFPTFSSLYQNRSIWQLLAHVRNFHLVLKQKTAAPKAWTSFVLYTPAKRCPAPTWSFGPPCHQKNWKMLSFPPSRWYIVEIHKIKEALPPNCSTGSLEGAFLIPSDCIQSCWQISRIHNFCGVPSNFFFRKVQLSNFFFNFWVKIFSSKCARIFFF